MDKWLWSVRLFKTRSLATQACSAGHVKVNGQRAKPARSVRVGELIEARIGDLLRTVKVRELLDRRVGAQIVPQYLEDLTPPAPRAQPQVPRLEPLFHRPKGKGRPTKRDRRLLDHLRLGEPP